MKNTFRTLKITLFQFFIFCSFSAFGQCGISALTAEMIACEEDLFDVSLDFEYENTSDQFTVSIYGVDYGTFNYSDVPITITSIESDCNTEYPFVVTDINDNNCSEEVLLPNICCDEECEIVDLVLTTSECDGVSFDLTIDFDFMWGTSSTFDWEIPGMVSGSAYFWQLPLTVQITDEQMDILGFVVNMTGNSNCAAETSFENPCQTCSIGDLNVDLTDCVDGEFGVVINFESENTSDQFVVAGNGVNYGTYSYADLPITIDGFEGNCSTQYEFVVTDVNNDDCNNFYELGTVCCGGEECDLFDLVIETTECDGTEFGVTFDFEYTGTTNNFFDWEIPGESSGFAEFSDLPLTVGVDNTSSETLILIINENDNPDCAIDGSFENPCFEAGDCFIGELDIDASDCNGNQFFVMINFEYENTSDAFFVIANGENYGPYFYTNLPVTIQGLEGNCDVPYEFLVYDSEFNGTCESDSNIGIVCCDTDCEMTTLDFGANPACENGLIVTEWLIDGVNISEVGFDIYINNVFEVFVEYNDSDWYDFDIEDPGTEFFTIKVCDNDNPDCCIDWELMNPCFDSSDCFIGDLNVDVSECDGNQFFVVIDFDYENTSDEFFVNANGENYGPYLYGSLPITIQGLEGNCDASYFLSVYDSEFNGTCGSEADLGIICCESDDCILSDMILEATDCVDGVTTLTIDFDHQGATSDFFDWEIEGTGLSGTALLEDLPISIDVQNSDFVYLVVFININDNESCSLAAEILNPCNEDECEFLDLVIETSECDGGFFEVTFDFDYSGNINSFFDWEISGYSSGVGAFSDLPLTVLIENTNMNGFDLFINENDNPNCAIEGSFENPCFEIEDCFIGELEIEVSECNGNQFFVVIDFEYENTSDQFTVAGNGNNYGIFSYADLPITIDGLESDCNLIYEFVVIDVNNNDCASDTDIGEVCCEGEDCEIVSIDFGPNPICEEGFIVTEWFIFGENTSEVGYDVFINNEFYIFVDYNGNGPYDFDIEDPETEYFTIMACDNDNPDCCYTWEVMNPCFEEEECNLLDLVIETSECDGGIFEVTFDFEYSGTTNDSFDWEIPGYSSGFADFNELPLTIIVQNTNANGYDLFINENDNPDCATEGSFENPCFENEDCFIGELNVEVSECDGNFFFVVIDFDYENTSDQFTVNGNGNSYGTFSYANLPITIDGLESDCDLQYEFVVHDVEFDDCASDVGIGEVCCDEDVCEIVTIDFGPNPVCEEGFIITEWLIVGANNSEVGYDIFINNEFYLFVEYNDSDWYDFDIENPGTEYFTIMACDNDNADCCYTWEVMNPCFEGEECDLFELVFDTSECDDDFFIVTVDFEYTGNTSESFVWEIPGIGSGTVLFSELPITVEIENTTETQFTFFANEIDNPDCSIVGTFGNPCYDSEECIIDDVSAEVIECEEDVFNVEINFDYENVGSTFTIAGNGVEYGTFEYSDLPIVLTGLDADCALEYEFEVNDNENQQCSDFVEIGTICCDDFNQISGLQSETVIDQEIFNVTFDISNTTLRGCKIEVYVGGELYETLSDDEDSFSIGPFNCGQDDIIEIKLVNSCSGDELTLMFDLANIDCVTSVEESLENIDLKWNNVQKTLTLEGEVPVSIDVQLINTQGALILSQNDVKFGWSKDLSNFPGGIYFVRIIDNESIGKNGLIKKIMIY